MQEQAFLLEKERLIPWLEDLRKYFQLVGPVDRPGNPAFVEVQSAYEINPDYDLTEMGPQTAIYHTEEKLCTIHMRGGKYEIEVPETAPQQVLFGVHSCDLHAILVLDKAFLKDGMEDRNYRLWRENTVIIGLHCLRVYRQCFCSSMGTGPLFNVKGVYDILLTNLDGGYYLAETLGERALKLMEPLGLERATEDHFEQKRQVGRELEKHFRKKLDTSHVVDSLLNNLDHPVWRRTADQRCLNCTNCTMVCPTCFCYNTKDHMSFDLSRCDRTRYKDSCQELHFAQVHGGNFRNTRTARLRQFVTHKLATWWEQFGCFGCIGCGRCMTWCPTSIDLTTMAKEIMASEKSPAVKEELTHPEKSTGP